MTQTIKVERKFDFVINLLTSLDNICFEMESNSITGYLSKRSDLSFENIQEQLESFGLDTSDNERKTGKIIVPLTGTNIFYDLEHYLKKDSRRLDANPTKSFYIYDHSVKYTPGTTCINKELNNIFLIAELFSNLKLISDLHGDAGNRSFIIFVGKKNLKIYSDYHADDLARDLNLIKNFIREYIQNDFHQEDRHLAVINGLHESYKENEISLSVFLKGFDTLYRMVKSNFQLYMDKFSFNDFKNKVEEDRREYTIKINKVFSDMQNQLLTLPIATVLAAGQMDSINSASGFIKNTLIMIGIIIFCVFVLMQIANQKITLKALDEEIKLRKLAMEEKDDSDYKTDYLKVYSSLDSRVIKLDDNLSLVKQITISATALVLLVFIARFFI
ncbi:MULTISPECIES: hypothetical protein [Acinetobacter calcoaceticus/baumannii complex]|uniref:hypothetical protein n=1 Tax=Acinetobacter calcoaceticus/baumannii complex TaxID=909768 RepID=UPI0002EB0C42|nr:MULTISPECIES: hypothetical protein [Acinetobacter calcoaceticus/baumannii complex]KCZ31409.1 hypothetical protein J812_2413 [Acinetobacter baumannii 25977_9]EXR63366.1 hypothetical protein J678_1861 [Acinetobacter sp. 1424608]EXT38409.1 hypothetical protein J811_2047 [Acinetobacter sp. 25977_8]EXT44394.1 hypothetical protein J810_1832 [Acinetobacter sp. 25977_7]EXT48834.1 hypothetical protein J809_0206 [Acinetobacter sp. 25977_6]